MSESRDWVIAPPPQAAVPVVGGGRFPVRRIYCVGRNYAAHVREMGGNEREPPFFFQKPADALVPSGATIPYPMATQDFQHEIELVLAISGRGRNVAVADARSLVFGVAVGIDLTRRDLQFAARDAKRPWEPGKAFDASAPITSIVPLRDGPIPMSGRIALAVNGVVKQEGRLEEMIWNCEEIIAKLSTHYELMPGDLIYTGTPAGVGKLAPGDRVEGVVEGVGTLALAIAS